MAGSISATTLGLISAAVGLTGAGVGAYNANNASIDNSANQAAQKASLLQQQQTQANQANLSKQEAVLGATGQAQQQTGGSLTDPGTTALTDLLAGYPGFQGGSSGTSATATSTGTGTSASSSPTNSAGGTPDIAAILAALRGQSGASSGLGSSSNISGGNWQSQPPQPQAWQELANPVI